MQKFQILFFFILCFLFIHGSPKLLVDYPFRYCSDSTLSPNSTYFTNLKALSSALSSNASRKSYHRSSAGRPPNPTAYGDFQCRGDLNATACRQCVAAAAANSSQQFCPRSVEAFIWLDECFFRYSNQSFFSVVVQQTPLVLINGEDIEEDVLGFNKVVGATLNETVANASSSSSSSSSSVKLFATREANFRDAVVYTLAQCTGDLSESDCGKCLGDALQNFPDSYSGKKGARILLPSCTIRYELYAFYGGVSLSPSPSISTPPASAPAAVPPPTESPPDLNSTPAQTPSPAAVPPPPDLPSSPSAPAPSTAAPPLLSGKWGVIVKMVIGIVAATYFL